MTVLEIPGQRVRRTRLVRTDKYIIAVEVEAVVPDVPGADPSEACYEPETVELLREIEAHAQKGDINWLKKRGKVYAALDAA